MSIDNLTIQINSSDFSNQWNKTMFFFLKESKGCFSYFSVAKPLFYIIFCAFHGWNCKHCQYLSNTLFSNGERKFQFDEYI